MRFLRRSLVGLFLLAATLGILAYAGQTVYGALQARWSEDAPSRPARERVFAVDVVTITPETVTPVMTSFGEVRARRTLDVRATASGTVTALAETFEEGGRVEEGALLLRVDRADAESAVEVARTDLAEAVAELAEARRALGLARDEVTAAEEQARLRAQATERQRNLQDRGVVTDAAVEAAELAEAAAEQAVLARRQALAQAEAGSTRPAPASRAARSRLPRPSAASPKPRSTPNSPAPCPR
jgi:multidrug efflux pump subunit AcrA (membrane-fusion protein)